MSDSGEGQDQQDYCQAAVKCNLMHILVFKLSLNLDDLSGSASERA